MIRHLRLAIACVVSLVLAANCPRAAAGFVTGSDFLYFSAKSWTANGSLLNDFSQSQPKPYFETYDAFAVDTHRGIVYMFGNTLGEITGVPYSLNTGAPLFTYDNINGIITSLTGNAVDLQFAYTINNGMTPAFYGIADPKFSDDSLGRNVLEAIRYKFAGSSYIESIHGDTGAVLQQVDAPAAAPNLSSIALGRGSNAALYAAGSGGGIYIYDNFRWHGLIPTAAPQLLVPGVTGELDVGLDNSLYVTSSGSIHRYNGTTGADLGTFLSPADIGGNYISAAEFALNGDLYVLAAVAPQASRMVYRVNGMTGQVLSSLSGAGFYGSTKIIPTPVPEPATFSLAVVASAGFARRRRVAVRA
jgi:hypothetical protein